MGPQCSNSTSCSEAGSGCSGLAVPMQTKRQARQQQETMTWHQPVLTQYQRHSIAHSWANHLVCTQNPNHRPLPISTPSALNSSFRPSHPTPDQAFSSCMPLHGQQPHVLKDPPCQPRLHPTAPQSLCCMLLRGHLHSKAQHTSTNIISYASLIQPAAVCRVCFGVCILHAQLLMLQHNTLRSKSCVQRGRSRELLMLPHKTPRNPGTILCAQRRGPEKGTYLGQSLLLLAVGTLTQRCSGRSKPPWCEGCCRGTCKQHIKTSHVSAALASATQPGVNLRARSSYRGCTLPLLQIWSEGRHAAS